MGSRDANARSELEAEQQFHDRMTSRARPEVDRISSVLQAAIRTRREAIGTAVPRDVEAPRVIHKSADEIGGAQFDEQVVGSIVVTDDFDHLWLGFGNVARRVEGADERDRSRMREAVEFLVQARSRDLPEWRSIEATADDAKPVSKSGLEHFDHRVVGARRSRMAVECHANVNSALTRIDERSGEPTIPKVVAHPVDRPALGNASNPLREQIAQKSDGAIGPPKVHLVVTHRRIRPRRDAAIFNHRSGTDLPELIGPSSKLVYAASWFMGNSSPGRTISGAGGQ